MFLYRKENTLTSELCRAFISTFETSDETRPGVLYGADGSSSTGGKRSTDITFTPEYLKHQQWGPLLEQLIPVIQAGQQDYISRHQLAMSNLDPIDLSSKFNMQRYNPGESFSSWHCERASLKYSDRVLVWAIYLNTVTDRGETEFYYQHHFESAVEGKLIIWPSDWTYLHRGVASLTQTKYILTGWFNQLQRPI
jgi:hypothetical protein